MKEITLKFYVQTKVPGAGNRVTAGLVAAQRGYIFRVGTAVAGKSNQVITR